MMTPTRGLLSGTWNPYVGGKVAHCAIATPAPLAMPLTTPQSSRDALLFHAGFFVLALPMALLLRGAALGQAILLLALAYNLALPLIGHWRGHRQWLRLWAFLLPLSVSLPCADWMLAERMHTLSFPDHGIPRLGGVVPVYFMGLWIMLLWPLTLLAEASRRPYPLAAALALLLFAGWELAAAPLGLWQAVGVRAFAGAAYYPLPAELLLSLATLWMWRRMQVAPLVQQVLAALAVTVFYAGALSLSLLWIQ